MAVGTIIQTSTDELSYLDIELPQATWPMPRAGVDKGALCLWQDYPHNAARLFPNSVVQITRLNRARTGPARLSTDEIRLKLTSGEIAGVVPQMGEGSSYEVEFRVLEGVGAARIRSGRYSIRHDGLLHMRSGSGVVSLPGGKPPIEVQSGYVFIASTGELLPYESYRIRIRLLSMKP